MIARFISITFVILSILFITTPSWGVTGNAGGVIKDEVGKTVPHARMDFIPADPALPAKTTHTNAQGQYNVTLDAGEYWAVVNDGDFVRTGKNVPVRANQTTTTNFTVDPVFPWMMQSPGSSLGFSLGIGGEHESMPDLELTRFREIQTDFFNGMTLGPFEFSPDLGEVNADFDFELTENKAFFDIAIGLGKRRFRNWLFYPAFNGKIGANDITFKVKDKVDPESSLTLEGTSPVFGAGINFIGRPVGSPWHAELSYNFETWTTGLDPKTPVTDPFGDVTSSSFRVTYKAHSFNALAGYSFEQGVTASAGVGYTLGELTLNRSVESIIFPGFTSRTDITQEFKADNVEGIGRVDVRIPFMPHTFARVEGATDGCNYAVFFKIMCGFFVGYGDKEDFWDSIFRF